MRAAIVLHSPVEPHELLRRISRINLWRDSTGGIAEPYSFGSRHLWARVHREHFHLFLRSIRINTFAPVLTGTVTPAAQGGSVIHAHFRFIWQARISPGGGRRRDGMDTCARDSRSHSHGFIALCAGNRSHPILCVSLLAHPSSTRGSNRVDTKWLSRADNIQELMRVQLRKFVIGSLGTETL